MPPEDTTIPCRLDPGYDTCEDNCSLFHKFPETDCPLCEVIVAEERRQAMRLWLREAVGRGWTRRGNQHKEMDPQLAEAIVEEVLTIIDG